MCTKMLKQNFGLILALLLVAGAAGCGNQAGNQPAKVAEKHTLQGKLKLTLAEQDDFVTSVSFSMEKPWPAEEMAQSSGTWQRVI
jgi:hypothetical protein